MNWIKVEDGLPEIDETGTSRDVLVSGTHTHPDLEGEEFTTIGWLNDDGTWSFVLEFNGNRLDPVRGWMNMPEPLQKNGENND